MVTDHSVIDESAAANEDFMSAHDHDRQLSIIKRNARQRECNQAGGRVQKGLGWACGDRRNASKVLSATNLGPRKIGFIVQS
jgi:hypothetical protein